MTPQRTAQRTAQQILARLGELRAGKLPPERRSMALEDLEALAREVTTRIGGRQCLGDLGAIYVTLSAAREYGASERIHDDELARRELTELLLDARQESDGLHWRCRRRSEGLDLMVLVDLDGRLAIVTHVSVRPYKTSGGR